MSIIKFQNKLLLGLSASDHALLAPQLILVELEHKQSIEKANIPVDYVYFPESGIISVVAKSANHQIEAALVGREGMTGTAVVLGNHRSPNDALVQMAGSAYRISARRLRKALETSKTLRHRLQSFVQVFMVQVAQTGFANGKAQIDVRLARWLLMVHDRYDHDELKLTHELIAVMLGVRRPSVTEALQALEGEGLIRASRGIVRIVKRKGLVALAGELYGVTEAEHERLLGIKALK